MYKLCFAKLPFLPILTKSTSLRQLRHIKVFYDTSRFNSSQYSSKSSPNTSNMAGFFRGEHYDVNKDIPDLSGRTFLVTGGSAGIGLGITSHIVQHNPKKLLFLSNESEHANEAKEHMSKYGDTSKVEWIQCDLNDLHQVQSVSQKIRDEHPEIDVAVFNAGIGVGKFELSKDGYDTHFQTNVLSQFLMLKTLLPNLKARAKQTGDARVVFQSSSMHDMAIDGVEFKNIEEINTDVGATKLYSRTKLALILIVRKLEKELKTEGVTGLFVNASHPGLVGTDQQGQAVEAYGTAVGIANKVLRPIMKDPIDAGCRPALFAACAPDVAEKQISGEYIMPDKQVADPSEKAQDEGLSERLWSLSDQMLQKTLGSTV